MYKSIDVGLYKLLQMERKFCHQANSFTVIIVINLVPRSPLHYNHYLHEQVCVWSNFR